MRSPTPSPLDRRLAKAIRFFWQTRTTQGQAQGRTTGRRDQGTRTEVTGGKHLDAISQLLCEVLTENGIPDAAIHRQRSRMVLPGYYRPTKQWDLLLVAGGQLFGVVELKAHVSSFGNNANNRVEEALGNATDLWAAYGQGIFKPSPQPWLGYFIIVEDAPASRRPLKPRSYHFPVLSEFEAASYIERYAIFCTKLVRERLYNAACLITSSREEGLRGRYKEPSVELTFANFIGSLAGHALGHFRQRPPT